MLHVRVVGRGPRDHLVVFQTTNVLCRQLISVAALDHAFRFELFGVKTTHAFQLPNPLIHHRLSHHGFISFVVTVAAVADEIDNHVFAELVSPIHSQLGDEHHGFGVVAIDVENGGLNQLGDVGAVKRRA